MVAFQTYQPMQMQSSDATARKLDSIAVGKMGFMLFLRERKGLDSGQYILELEILHNSSRLPTHTMAVTF